MSGETRTARELAHEASYFCVSAPNQKHHLDCDRIKALFEQCRNAALEEAAQEVENNCECDHGTSLYGVTARIRALKARP